MTMAGSVPENNESPISAADDERYRGHWSRVYAKVGVGRQ
jgi:hypothetical protein